MKPRNLSLYAIALIASGATAFAGTPAPSAKTPVSPVATTPPADEWKVTSWAYGWLAGVEGTTGVKGFTSEIDIPFSGVLDHLDMTASLNLEAQKGRWGGWVDAMYLKVSAGGSTPDPLFDVINITQTQVAAEAAIFYRVWEGQRGALDLYAGARYMSIKGELELTLSDSGVEQVSSALSSKVIDEIVSGVKSKAAQELAAKRPQLTSQIAAKASDVLSDLKAIGQAHPGLGNAIKNSERLQQAIRNAAAARVQEQLAIVQGQVAAAKAAARRAVNKAEKALANEIERALRNSIPSELSGTKDWVDPFIGVRGYYNFTNDFYAVTKADIGGFGISSDLTWQVYAALGYHLSKSTTLEVGYKYMAVDYTSGGFTNDVRTSGVFLNLGLKL
ncbi:MAG: hypothetical protein JNM99_15810 [Verrucomicrobiaceae bacterium]|nr:hypothetical protein [Verrucomicrobiaceae bacterium]